MTPALINSGCIRSSIRVLSTDLASKAYQLTRKHQIASLPCSAQVLFREWQTFSGESCMYCAKCGEQNLDTNRSCRKCGASLIASGEQNAWSPSNASIEGERAKPTSDVYAGFWPRVGAYVIDYFVYVAGSFVLGIALAPVAASESAGAIVFLVSLLAMFFYDVLMHCSSYQATLGKLALGIKVTDLAGERIGFAQATGRFFAEILTAFTIGIGYVMAAFTERRQTLHDKIAGTLVVKKSTDIETVASAGPAGPVRGGAILAIVLVATVPVIGILAAIAIPAYQDYTIRSQVTTGLTLAAAHKGAVAAAWNTESVAFDAIDSETVGADLVSSGPYVQSIEIQSGAVVITYGGQAHQQLQGHVLALVPAVTEDGEMAWACGYGDAPGEFEIIFEDHGQYTDVPEKLLPSACRSGVVPSVEAASRK
jgi:uncharacterized RDD family membrane protein YckC/Tfp pilus assembly major pilin PilA